MTHRYQLDLSTLLTLLTGQTGQLHTAGVQLSGIEAPCEVVVSALAGQVQECRVVSLGQVVLQGKAALQHVLALGVLSWTYTPDLPLPTAPPAHADTATLVPQRVREVPLSELGTWSRLPRILYQLTDGKRSVAHLSHLLTQPQTQIVASLLWLEQQGIIGLVTDTPHHRLERVISI